MDDLLSKFNELILQTFAAESRLEEEFQKCTQKLDDHVSQSITAGTPVQNKKRPKRLDSIDGDGFDQEHESSSTSSSTSGVSKLSQRKNSVHEKQREKQRSLAAAVASAAASMAAPSAPEPTPELEESSRQSSSRSTRPTRLKVCKSYKEPTLSSKMRQPSLAIKKERISMEARKQQDEPMELDVENDGNVMNGVVALEKNKEPEKRKSNDEGFGSTNEKEKEPEDSALRETSIMVIPQPIPKIEVVSDDEAAEKMPPPSMPPPSMPAPKTRGRTKRTEKSKVKKSESFSVSIKREKDADEASTSAVSSAESTISNASNKSSGRGRKKKDSTQADVEKVRIKTEKLSTDGKDNKAKAVEKPTVNSPTQSEKSVYEDALDTDTVMRPMVVSLNKMALAQEPEKNQTFAMDKNGTFNVQSSNGTFVVPTDGADGTFHVKSPEANSTFNVRQLPGPGNNTFVLEKKSTGEPAVHINASIMTEDNSHIEESPEKLPVPPAKKPAVAKKPATLAKTNSKKHNELFSLQSPIKSRIEAFEKAAVGSPYRTGANKNNTPSQSTRLTSKASTTPLASQRFATSAKSVTQTTPTAQNALPLSKGISASASKLAHLQKKPTTASGAAVTKSQSLSREPSVERLGTLSAASSSSSLAIDEKKKKREEKQRLAQQQREQMEKEKREHAERLMREKEEKHRKLVQEKEDKLRAELVKKAKKMEEFEKRRHLEELNQRLQAEQKREELVKLEQQQRTERDQAELFKMNQAKENYEIKLHKQMYQQKMQQQQKAQQAQQLQQQQLQLKKVKQSSASQEKSDKVYFNFDMIETDDSTDDESTSASKKTKRPPLPSWCSKEERRLPIRIQSEIKLKSIDQFFSVAPMTPDLREIFPAIDARKLKRNSSAVWRTPPRYSQMPKY